ncbi:MAG: hypothetical protein AB6733_03550 [Clostridiaceae bacterium]
MGVYAFASKMLKVNFKQCVFYLISVLFSVAIIFNAINLMCNDKFISFSSNTGEISSMIVFALTIVAVLFTFYANSYFINGKTKELAIAALSGVWSFRLSSLLLFQNLVIVIIGSFFGIILGLAIMPLFLSLMYRIMGTSGQLWDFTFQSFSGTLMIVAIQFFYVSFGDYMYLTKKEIKDLLVEQRQVYTPDTRVVKFPPVVYLVIYFIPVALLFVSQKNMNPAALSFLNVIFSILGIQGVVSYYLPKKVMELKKGRYIANKIKLITLSNLHHSLRSLSILIIVLSVSSVILICMIGLLKTSKGLEVLSVFSYVSIVALVAISILYKTLIEVENRKYIFKQLKLIGYTSVEIIKIIRSEVSLFYLISAGLPFFHILIYIIIFKNTGILSLKMSLALLSIYVVVFLFVSFFSYILYKRIVFKK